MKKNFKYVAGAKYPYQYRYEHMAVTTDCVIFTYEEKQLKILLIKRAFDPYKGLWAFPGGFLQINESAREGALRELKEETGMNAAAIGELGVFSDVDRDPRERVITIAYYALVKPSEVIGGDDAAEAAWFPVDNLPELAFDHKKIFDAAIERLRRDIHFQPIGFDLLDENFTIPDLQRLYEAIIGVKFDRRNFQRKIMALGILEESNILESEDNGSLYDNNYAADIEPELCLEACLGSPETICGIADENLNSKPKNPHSRRSLNQRQRKGHPGRTASLYRLNKERYNQMKSESGKTEF